LADWTPRLLLGNSLTLRWMTAGRKARSAALLVSSMPSVSRKVHNASATFRSFWQVRTVLAHGVRSPR